MSKRNLLAVGLTLVSLGLLGPGLVALFSYPPTLPAEKEVSLLGLLTVVKYKTHDQ